MHLLQDFRIELARRLGLTGGLDLPEALQERIVAEIPAAATVGPRTKLGMDPPLPVDERSVAVEGQRVEVGHQRHGRRPRLPAESPRQSTRMKAGESADLARLRRGQRAQEI